MRKRQSKNEIRQGLTECDEKKINSQFKKNNKKFKRGE